MTEALLVDFGGTLDGDGLPWLDRFFAIYSAGGGVTGAEEFGRAFRESDAQLAALPRVAEFGFRETVAAQCGLLAGLLADGALLHRLGVADRFAEDAMAAAARNRAALAALRADFRIAVVSNYQGNLDPSLRELGLRDVVDAAVDSAVFGARKPDPAIFAFAASEVGAALTECWMVGDSPVNDIAPARTLGMRTCWVAPAKRRALTVAPTLRVARVADLPDALEAVCTR